MYKIVYRSQGRSKTGWVIEDSKGSIVNDFFYDTKAEAQKKLDLLKALGFAE